MSAETLRRAAALMRERAESAAGMFAADDCNWYEPSEVSDALASAAVATDTQSKSDAEHIASWHPAVALAVAEWIDGHGRDLESSGGHLPSCDSPGDVQQALEVARAYLGESA